MAEMAASPSVPGGKPRLLHQVMQQILDARRVLALEKGHQVIEQRQQRLVRPVIVAFAPARQAVIGVDGDDDARAILVARHIGAHPVDFHDSLIRLSRRRNTGCGPCGAARRHAR